MTGPPPPNPRLALGLLTVIVILQGFFAGTAIFDGTTSDDPIRLVVRVAFVGYVLFIAAFAFGVWRSTAWAWSVGMAVAGYGLVLAGLQVLGGDPLDRHLLGMVIDGALLYYLSKQSTRALFDG